MIASNKIIGLRKDVPSATIILQRPDCRNALNRTMVDLLIEAFEDFQQERKVRALILTGSGQSFCSGTDLREIQQTREEKEALDIWYRDVNRLQELIEIMLRFPKPIICAIHGPAMGTGLALALASDIVIASRNASFAMPEGQVGLTAGITAPLLAFRLGMTNAASLLYTGQPMDAESAQRVGLVQNLVEDDMVWVQAHEIAKQCAGNAIQSVQMTKQLLNETVGENLFTQLSIGAANMATARTTDIAAQGIEAFFDKKPMEWD